MLFLHSRSSHCQRSQARELHAVRAGTHRSHRLWQCQDSELQRKSQYSGWHATLHGTRGVEGRTLQLLRRLVEQWCPLVRDADWKGIYLLDIYTHTQTCAEARYMYNTHVHECTCICITGAYSTIHSLAALGRLLIFKLLFCKDNLEDKCTSF